MRVTVTSAHDAWLADPKTPHYLAAKRVLHKNWGIEPLCVREGGTSRLTRVLEIALGAPAMLVPLGQSSDAAHLPNERLRLQNLLVGTAVMRDLFAEFEKPANLPPQR